MTAEADSNRGRYRVDMPERIKRQTDTNTRADEATDVSPGVTADGQRLRDEIDDLLDEIDEVLETNAEDFVRSYVQKGGQ